MLTAVLSRTVLQGGEDEDVALCIVAHEVDDLWLFNTRH